MKYSSKALYPLLLTAILITACNDSGSSNGTLQQFTNSSGDSSGNSIEIMNPVALEQDLNKLFGTPNSEPVDIISSDTVSSIIQRID